MEFNNPQHEEEPAYDLEFHNGYGPNVLDMPPSPPATPPLDQDDRDPFVRDLSPFSTNTSMTSVDSQDSVGYYREEAGRMFAAMPEVPFVLPVDHAEMRRVSQQHELLRAACGDTYDDDIRALLLPEEPRSLRVLDVLSNTPWIDDMAEEYPHVKFHGCNFVPTRHPHRDNLLLEVYNLNEGLRGKDASFDMIHAYGCFKMTTNFKSWLSEMKRLLKPGGILIVYDLEMALWLRDGTNPWDAIPTICLYTDCVNRMLLDQGIDLSKMSMTGQWLREMGGFTDIDDIIISIPIGEWVADDEFQRELGASAQNNVVNALVAVHPLWHRMGKTQEEIDKLVTAARRELFELNLELFERLFYVFARRTEDD